MFANIILLGNIGKEPELRYTQTGKAVLNFSLAVNKSRLVNDAWQTETTWFKVTVWNEEAERLNEKLAKGKQVLVQADGISASAYTTSTGEVRASLEITANKVRLLGKNEAVADSEETVGSSPLNTVDEIPF